MTASVPMNTEITLSLVGGRAFYCDLLTADANKRVIHSPKCIIVRDVDIIDAVPVAGKQGVIIAYQIRDLTDLSTMSFTKSMAGMISLSFKDGKTYKYRAPKAMEWAETIKENMKKIGVSGKVDKSVISNESRTAEVLLMQTQELESQFDKRPSLALIQKIMDLLRESTEHFDAANDKRFNVVVTKIKAFLRRHDVQSILENSKKPTPTFTIESTDSAKYNRTPNMQTTPKQIETSSSLFSDKTTQSYLLSKLASLGLHSGTVDASPKAISETKLTVINPQTSLNTPQNSTITSTTVSSTTATTAATSTTTPSQATVMSSDDIFSDISLTSPITMPMMTAVVDDNSEDDEDDGDFDKLLSSAVLSASKNQSSDVDLNDYLGDITAEFNEILQSFSSPMGTTSTSTKSNDANQFSIDDISRLIDSHSFLDEDI